MIKKFVLAAAMLGAIMVPVQAEVPGVGPNTSASTSSNASVSDAGASVDDKAGSADDKAETSVATGGGPGQGPNVSGVRTRSGQVASLSRGDTTCRVLPQRTARKKGNC